MENNRNMDIKKKNDFLSLVFRWKKMIFINLTIVAIISLVISFLIPKTYKAAAYVLPAPSSGGLGGLSSLLSENSMLSVGSKLLGIGGAGDEETILGLLNSRTVLNKIINKYDLYKYYEIDDRNLDLAIKSFSANLYFDMNEFGFLEIAVENKDPKMSAVLANEFVRVVDSVNIQLKSSTARNNRLYIEKRYLKNQEDLKIAEENFNAFQKQYGAYAVPEQVKATITAVAELEAQLIENETMLQRIKSQVSSNSPMYQNVAGQIKAIKDQINKMSDSNSGGTTNVLPQIKNLPDLQLQYIRLFREVEIQNTVLKFLYPLYEQTKLEEQKNSNTIIVIEKAVTPGIKYRPNKGFIVLIGLSIAILIHLLLLARYKNLLNISENYSEFEEKEFRFYNKIRKIYSI